MRSNISVFCIHSAVKSSDRGFSEDHRSLSPSCPSQAELVRQKPPSVENLFRIFVSEGTVGAHWHFCASSVLFILDSAQDLTAKGPEQPALSRGLDSKGLFQPQQFRDLCHAGSSVPNTPYWSSGPLPRSINFICLYVSGSCAGLVLGEWEDSRKRSEGVTAFLKVFALTAGAVKQCV